MVPYIYQFLSIFWHSNFVFSSTGHCIGCLCIFIALSNDLATSLSLNNFRSFSDDFELHSFSVSLKKVLVVKRKVSSFLYFWNTNVEIAWWGAELVAWLVGAASVTEELVSLWKLSIFLVVKRFWKYHYPPDILKNLCCKTDSNPYSLDKHHGVQGTYFVICQR